MASTRGLESGPNYDKLINFSTLNFAEQNSVHLKPSRLMSTHGSLALEQLRNSVGKGSNLVTDVGDASVGVAGSRTDLQLMGTKIDLEKPTIGLEHQAIIKQ